MTGEVSEEESATSIVGYILDQAPITMHEISQATEIDPELTEVKTAMHNKWAANSVTELVKPYHTSRNELSISNEGLILLGSRIVIPVCLRQRTLAQAHAAQVGV